MTEGLKIGDYIQFEHTVPESQARRPDLENVFIQNSGD